VVVSVRERGSPGADVGPDGAGQGLHFVVEPKDAAAASERGEVWQHACSAPAFDERGLARVQANDEKSRSHERSRECLAGNWVSAAWSRQPRQRPRAIAKWRSDWSGRPARMASMPPATARPTW